MDGAVSDRADAALPDASRDADAGFQDVTSEGADVAEGDVSGCRPWSYWNDGLTGGNFNYVQFDPRTAALVLAVAGSQLYRSTDSGQTWTLLTNNTGGGIAEMAFPPGSPNVLLAATGDGFRRSDDGGQTWTTRSLQGVPLTSLLVDRTSPQRIFVGGDQGLLMRSTDGGGTWRAASSGVPFGQIMSLAGDPSTPDNVLATVILEDANGSWKSSGAIVRSTNGGLTWATVLNVNGFAQRLAQCIVDPKVIYAGTAIGVVKSIDGGQLWSPFMLAGMNAADIGVDSASCDHIYAAIFPSGIAHSTNGGTTWSPAITQGLTLQEGYQQANRLSVDPKNGASVVAATHDGIFRSTNGGDNWLAATGLESVLCRDLRVSPTAPQQLWMASWGSGAWRRPSSGAPWQRIPLDRLPREWLMTVYPDTFVGGRVMVGTFLGGSEAWRSTDQGATFNVTNTASLNPFVFATDPTNNAVMYMGTQVAGVYKSIDGGVTWQPSNTGATDAFVLSILIDSDDGRTIYIGTQGSGILRSTDAGASWSSTTMGLGVGAIGSLVRFGGSLYAWVDGAGVHRSQNGMVWTPSNAGLEALNFGGIVVDTVVPRLFASAGAAVYTSADGTSWQPFEKGCPPPAGGGRPVIVSNGASRHVVLGAGTSGVVAHPL